MKTRMKTFLTLTALMLLTTIYQRVEAQFTPGRIVAISAQTIGTVTKNGSAVTLKEYATDGTPGYSYTLPTTGSTPIQIAGGSGGSEGLITRTPDGSKLVFAGYTTTATYASDITVTAGTAAPRSVYTVDILGNVTLVASNTTYYTGNDIRGAISDGTNYWSAGASNATDGINYYGPGTQTALAVTAKAYGLQIFNNQIYFSTQKAVPGVTPTFGIYALGSGMPTSGTITPTQIFTTGSATPVDFSFNPTMDVCYVAINLNSAVGGIQKWTKSGSTWSLAYTLGTGATNIGAYSLIVDYSGSNPVIYATTTELATVGNRIIKITDAGSSSAATTIVSATANTWYHGITFAPTYPVPSQPEAFTASTSSINQGQTGVTFTVPSDPMATSYNWSYSGTGATINGTGNSVTVDFSATATAGTLSVTASNISGTSLQRSVAISVNGSMKITEYMYNGGGASSVGEFIEFTNVGGTAVDMTGWSFDDNTRLAGSQDLSAFGIVQPGQSVILTEIPAATFRTNWNLCAGIKIIGGCINNLGRADEINLYDASSTLVDRLTYDDATLGGPRTTLQSAWVSVAGLGANAPSQWTLSTVADAEGSFKSTAATPETGSPGKSTRATVVYDQCYVPNGAPTIVFNTTTTNFIDGGVNSSPASPFTVSGVINDSTDPASIYGVDFTINDDLTAISSLTVTVTSSNQTVVPSANISLTGTNTSRNIKITPAAVGYSTITVTVNDGSLSTTYIIYYAASAASVTPSATVWHTGMSDASDAISIDDNYFISGDDELNVLNVYSRSASGLPVASIEYTSALNLPVPSKPEVDLEAGAKSPLHPNRIFWIGSMSNSKAPFNSMPNRDRIFATDITGTGASTTFSVVGYSALKSSILAWGDANGYNFTASAAAGVDSKSTSGFAAEGIVFGPDNTTLYMGLRAPLVPTATRTKAVIVPFPNFETWFNNGTPSGNPTIGSPIELDLGGRGFRDLIRLSNGTYIIVAGSAGADLTSAIYKWTGNVTDAPILVSTSANAVLNFEGAMEIKVNGELSLNKLQLVTDQGDDNFYNDGTEAKDFAELSLRKFRQDEVSNIDLTMPSTTPVSSNTKICSASDLHYFAPSLLVNNGTAFQTYLAQDRKMIAESKAITEALVKKINTEKPALFFVTGDLTKDGEKLSHQEMAKYLDSIEMNGVTKVYVIPGNHDVNNVYASSYDGATVTPVDHITAAEFSSNYSHFGYSEAASSDPSSLSYLAKPYSNLWVLGIDVCNYDDNVALGKSVTAGRFKPATWTWILARLAEAKAAGAQVIGLMHHGITEHYTGQSISFPEYVVAGWDTASVRLADAGLKLMFTGHYHANDITKKAGTASNFIYDIETGSTVTAPSPYRVMYLNPNNSFNITTKYITDINYNLGGKTFANYAKDFLTTGMNGIVNYTLMNAPYSLDAGTAAYMTPHVVSAYAAHYAGDEKISAAEQGFITGISSTPLAPFAPMLTALWTDLNPSDNNLSIDLATGTAQTNQTVQFIFTSDAHYGITRTFRGVPSTSGHIVNKAMIDKINTVPSLTFPTDGGVNAGKAIVGIDYVIEGGDIANRSEVASSVQSATASWNQFKLDYFDSLKLTNNLGAKTSYLIIPGNHDVTNAIGYYKTMSPVKDSAAMVNIFNMMMPTPRAGGNYDYTTEKINYSRNIGGVHFMFLNIWPDSAQRIWMAQDLKSVKLTTPVVIVAHDQPDIETKHLTNPNGTHNINATDKFENMVSEVCKDGKVITAPSTMEQAGLTQFLKNNRNIVAYFHGNDHIEGFYNYPGTDSSISLRTVHVDSPMKGTVSSIDETKLMFQTLSLDTITKQMTVRECLWNAGSSASTPVAFGNSTTLNLSVASNIVTFASTLNQSNYTVPTWTMLQKALATNTGDSASIVKLTTAINNLAPKAKPYSIVATINGNPKTQMGFAWFTNAGITGGQIQIVAGTATDASAFATPAYTLSATTETVTLNYNVTSNALPTASIPVNSQRSYVSNKALATGLTAGTTYSYRVGTAGAWSDIGTFTTAPDSKNAFSFIYFTDPQANTDAMFDVSQKTTHAALSNNPNANFVLNCGDLVETSGTTNSEWEYEQYFQTQQDIWLKKPLAPTEGNHDFSTNKNWTKHFNTANPSFDKNMATTPGSVYSFVYGDALFMALSYENYSTTGYLDSLAIWMNAQVKANPNVKWRIAFYHKTMYTGSSSHQSDADGKTVREKMGPVFDSLKIDWALQGHDHIYEVIGPVKAKALVAGEVSNQQSVTATVRDNLTGKLGGTFDVTQGTLYFLNNSAGQKKYEPRTQAQMTAAETGLGLSNYFGMFSGRFGQDGLPTFSNITVSTDSIKVSTYSVNPTTGATSLFDEYKIVKSIPVTSVSLSSKTKSTTVGNTVSLTTTISPVNASNTNVTWTSSDATIATLANGVITGVKTGLVKIFAVTVDGNKKDSCYVSVSLASTGYTVPSWNNYQTAYTAAQTAQNTTTITNLTNALKSLVVKGSQPTVQFVYTSDAHYGITRAAFQGSTTVNAKPVNAAMIAKINSMPTLTFPSDGGINAGSLVGGFDYLIETGDIANREETGIQSATASWAQFKTDYIDSLKLTNNLGVKSGLLLAPGNHDVSNAIGYYKTMSPLKDSATMVNIYNMMMPNALPTLGSYNYATSKIHYSKNIGGVHFMFVNMWPDSAERVWMTQDLQLVKLTTPVVIFTHDQPDCESKHFTNPNGTHNINSSNKFENLVSEMFKDGKKTINDYSTIEQQGFTQFVKAHRNIVAYFHGNSNANEYYTYRGSGSDSCSIALSTIRVDSPMKGNISATDETKLSFQTISLDTIAKQMTVRECLWNSVPSTPSTPVVFGASKTFELGVSTNLVAFANALVDTNYTVPSWTVLKKALAANTGDSASIATLTSAVNNLVVRTKPYNVVATFNGSPKTQMGFAWFTNKNITGGQVQIVAGTATDASAFASPAYTLSATTETVTLNYNVSANALPTASIPVNSQRSYVSNKALATGLTAGTTYSYRVGKAGSWSDIGTFTTAPDSKDAFSFIYYTDPQAQTASMFDVSQKTTHAALSNNPSANFVLNCGDLVETSGTTNSEWEYEQYFQTQQDIWLKKPLAPTEGNHDFSTNKNWTKHFNTANPSFDKNMATTPGSVYSFVYGDALFMALSYENYSTTGYLDSLAIWMNAQVKANPTVKWRIAFYHKTMYTGSGSHQSDADGKTVREKMGPVFDSLKIDWALQGHDHIYEVIGPVKAKALVAGEVSNQQSVTATVRDNLTGKLGGTFDVKEGTLYFLNNSAGQKKYEPRTQAQMAAVETGLGISNYFGMFSGRFGQDGFPTFSNITVSTDSIKVSTYSVNPTTGATALFDEYKIVKSKSNVNPTVSVSASATAVNVSTAVTLTATATDADGTIAKVEFFEGTTKLGSKTVAPFTYTFNSLTAGSHTFTAVATDNSNGTKTSTSITVVATNAKPTVELITSTNSITVGSNVDLTATAADVDGTIASVKYYEGSSLLGTKTNAPYKLVISNLTIGSHTINAVATDNLNDSTTSVSKTIVVNAIGTVTVTEKPVVGAVKVEHKDKNKKQPIALGDSTVISFHATHADTLDLYDNGKKIGRYTKSQFNKLKSSVLTPFEYDAATDTYTFIWVAEPGAHIFAVVAKNTAGTTSLSVSTAIATTYNVLYKSRYAIVLDDSVACNASDFIEVPVVKTNDDSLKNATGFDIVLSYDKSRVVPTGQVSINNQLINHLFVGTTVDVKSVEGKMNISVYLNGASDTATFNGTGLVASVTFVKTPNFKAVDSVLFAASLVESYTIKTVPAKVLSATFRTFKNTAFNGDLSFWADNSPIAGDSGHLATNIMYANIFDSTLTTHPDANGLFNLVNLNNKITITRDIDSTTDVMPVINGYDALLTAEVAVETAKFVPSIYQIIAMDVNMDGVISAGDVSQINKRTVKSINQFSQVGGLGKDWVFVDKASIASDTKYHVSTLYPLSDGKGYAKNAVPSVPSIFALADSSKGVDMICPSTKESYVGILLGDANGSYKNITKANTANYSSLKSGVETPASTAKVVFDYAKATTTTIESVNYLDVPVVISSSLDVNSLDFALQFDEASLQYVSIVNSNAGIKTMANAIDNTLRFTSYSMDGFETGVTVVSVRFRIVSDALVNTGVSSTKAYVNGEPVASEATEKGNNMLDATVLSASVYPNPTKDVINVVVSQSSKIEIFNVLTQNIYTLENAAPNQIHAISAQSFGKGTFYVKVSSASATLTKVITVLQ